MAKSVEDETLAVNLISAGTTIKGEVISNGDIRIDGSLIGSVETTGKIVVGTSGNINGQLFCKNSEVAGVVEGKISVSQLLNLKSTSKILGDIETTKLSIEPGALFTGTCKMTDFNGEPGTRTKGE